MESGRWKKKIRIWQDNWLPRKHPPHTLSCPLANFESATVDILIDPRSRQWNGDMVDGLFNTEEAKIIKSIPLSQEAAEDILFWPYSYDGSQASVETPLHALWSCTELDSVWSDTVLWSNRGSMQFMDFKELLSWQIKNKNQLELFAVIALTIWNHRNRVRLNQPADVLHELALSPRSG